MADGFVNPFDGSAPKPSGTTEFVNPYESRPGKSIAKGPGSPSFAQQMGGLVYGAGTELAGAPGEIEEFFTTSGKGEKLGGSGQALPCLLYTSDAADE